MHKQTGKRPGAKLKKKVMKFPKRFEIENVNPLQIRVKVVTDRKVVNLYDNLEAAEKSGLNFNSVCGPMWDTINGEPCVRFEATKK